MTCPRSLRALLLAGALALAQPAAAVALPRPVLATAGALQMAGAGEMRWFGLKLYDAALWVDSAQPAGAAGVAAMLAGKIASTGPTATILSGGNIDTRVLVAVLQRHLTRTGRMVRIRAELPDRPGSLAQLTAIIADNGGNIYELRHERFAAASLAKESAVTIDVELRDAADLEPMMQRLQACGFKARRDQF